VGIAINKTYLLYYGVAGEKGNFDSVLILKYLIQSLKFRWPPQKLIWSLRKLVWPARRHMANLEDYWSER
jgi:hypothetical protein